MPQYTNKILEIITYLLFLNKKSTTYNVVLPSHTHGYAKRIAS